MFFGALAQAQPGLEDQEGDGFVIITAASDEGMLDIHDRKPLVLTPDLAREWLNSELDQGRAEKIATDHCRPVEDFEWFPVNKAVGNIRSQGPDLIEPLISITLEW